MSEETTQRGQWIASHIIPCESQLRGWLRSVVPRGLEVDDIIQEGYAILSSLADVSRIENPRAYFYRILKSLIAEHFRRVSVASGGATLDTESIPDPQEGLTPERIVSGRQELDRLYRAITRLPEPARTIFVMRKIDNLPQKVIAERLRVSENVVENHVARGLRVILQQFAREDGSLEGRGAIPINMRRAGLNDA